MPSTPEALPAHGRKGFGISKVTDSLFDEAVTLRYGQIQSTLADEFGSVAQCALGGQAGGLGLLTKLSTRPLPRRARM